MSKRKFSLDKLLKDPLFWSILLLNLFVVFRYGSNIEFQYNLVVIQIIQTFCLIVAHYFLIRNTPIKYLKKKYKLNRTRKKTDKNRKEFGSYIDKDETGDSIFAAIFLIMGCFVSVFLLAIFMHLIFGKMQENLFFNGQICCLHFGQSRMELHIIKTIKNA